MLRPGRRCGYRNRGSSGIGAGSRTCVDGAAIVALNIKGGHEEFLM